VQASSHTTKYARPPLYDRPATPDAFVFFHSHPARGDDYHRFQQLVVVQMAGEFTVRQTRFFFGFKQLVRRICNVWKTATRITLFYTSSPYGKLCRCSVSLFSMLRPAISSPVQVGEMLCQYSSLLPAFSLSIRTKASSPLYTRGSGQGVNPRFVFRTMIPFRISLCRRPSNSADGRYFSSGYRPPAISPGLQSVVA
jgi:hypothetical protein